jgi:hypothetical protein
MKIDWNIQIPNRVVYVALYAAVFGISIWLLVFHADSNTDGYLYFAMVVSVLAGFVQVGLNSRKKQQQPF